jgi:hypothetical protein
MLEEWKPVEGFEDYLVSSNGDIYSNISKRLLKRYEHNHGYSATAFHKNKVRYQALTHRVVAKAFIPNPDNLPTVNHKDGNKKNNHISNLEWCSYLDNNLHALETGLRTFDLKYPEDLVVKVFTMIANGETYKSVSGTLGIPEPAIKVIYNEKPYQHLKDKVDWSNHLPRGRVLTDKQGIKVLDLIEEGKTVNEVVDYFKGAVKKKTVSNIRQRVVYKHLSEGYTFWRKKNARV